MFPILMALQSSKGGNEQVNIKIHTFKLIKVPRREQDEKMEKTGKPCLSEEAPSKRGQLATTSWMIKRQHAWPYRQRKNISKSWMGETRWREGE